MSIKFVWKIPIDAAPDTLWRYISDTNRVNQYAGLPEFTFRFVPEPDGGSRQVGETRYMGWRLLWDEHPFEWIEGRYFEIVREYHNGPIRKLQTSLILHPHDGGTLVEQTMTCEPRWFFAVPGIYWELAFFTKRRFLAAYRKIEKFLSGATATPFEPLVRESIPQGRLEVIREHLRLVSGGQWISSLIEAVETLPDDELDRMRPFVFADRWKADRREVLQLFLHASQAGLLDLSWDVICPGCRGAQERHSTLRNMREQAHCKACNVSYTADFAQSVEVTFQPNAAIRRVEVVRYCSGGPMNAPHVVAQQQIPAMQSRTLNLNLSPWEYNVRSVKLQTESFLTIRSDAEDSSGTITIHRPAIEPETLDLTPDLTLTLLNNDDRDIVMTIERVAGNENAATAAMVIAMNEFRTLFSEEVLQPDMPISVGVLTVMFTDLKASTSLYETIGEAPAYGLVRRHFDLLTECIATSEGAIVKTIGDSVMAAFMDPAKAVEAAFAMHSAIDRDNRSRGEPFLSLKIGIHSGPCIAVNLNDILDYFGTSVNMAARIQRESHGGDILVTEELWKDSKVMETLARHPHTEEEFEVKVRGLSGLRKVCRIQPSS